jgi:hypothetical protein
MARILACVLAIAAPAGCSTKRIQSQPLASESLPRPSQILVYDFAATPGEVPPEATIAQELSVEPALQTSEQVLAGRDLGSQIAAELAARLRDAGLPARHVAAGSTPPSTAIHDVVVRGYLVSVKKGSAARRVAIGFGSGASELQAAVEAFQVTAQGLRKLGSGTGRFGGSRAPGATAGAVGYAATGNPAEFIVSSGMRLYGEVRGSSKIQARAKTAAREIARVMERRARELGWIS